MRKFYKIFSSAMLVVILLSTFLPAVQAYQLPETKTVLFLNSYHSGYKWSDDIHDGIKSVLNADESNINLQVEYMDMQRNVDDQYLEALFETYKFKFRDRHFDLILSSDDAAFQFLINHRDELFPDTPVVFCGVNYFEQDMIASESHYTGVVEGFDIGSTIDIALSLHPDTEAIYYVVDNTTTGLAIMKEFSKVLPQYKEQLKVIRLDGENLDQITEKASNLPENSLILYLIYFKDNEGNHFEYNEAISMIEQKATIPVYGVWEFTLGHGIIGGKLTSGFYQGKTAANIALRVLSGEKLSEIPVVIEETTHYGFDYKQMKKNDVKAESLPPSSILINITKTSKKQILILHSYNRGLQWTDDLELGISSSIKEYADSVELIYEYMDVKRYTDPVYLQNISELLARKHKSMEFDLIITTDDVAFNYITKRHDTIYKDVPTIFCGLNYYEESMIENHPSFTGVVESYDLRGTIDTALKIQPEIKNIIVINDTTVTGQANRKNLDLLMPDYQDKISFQIWDDFNMLEIQEKVQTLESDSIILLLSFNLDKSNNSFSYGESISMISEQASVPIYGLWDFYLGHGLTGGVLTTGIVHGETAGAMAVDILNGKKPSEIAVVTDSPNIAMFDYTMLKKFDISLSNLPAQSIVINRPNTILDHFLGNKIIVIPFIGILSILCLIVLIMLAKIKRRKTAEEQERHYALTDPLTGIPNRRAGIEHLTNQIRKSRETEFQTTICFIDVNKLKRVNDKFGHSEGDNLINTLCLLIKSKLREVDMFFRFGGDEFLIIFNDADLTQATVALERICEGIAVHNQTEDMPYEISISYGLAQYNQEECLSVDELIERADKEMYQNKIAF